MVNEGLPGSCRPDSFGLILVKLQIGAATHQTWLTIVGSGQPAVLQKEEGHARYRVIRRSLSRYGRPGTAQRSICPAYAASESEIYAHVRM